MFSLQPRVLLSEFLGTMFLLIGVIGSGIMAERLSPSDSGLQLLQNAAATTGVLIAIISIFGTVSADFNPAVTISAWVLGHRDKKEVVPVIISQISDAVEQVNQLDNDYVFQINSNNTSMLYAYDAIQLLVVSFKVDMLQALSVSVDYVDADGD